VSVVAGSASLVVVYLSLRPRLGRAAALWTLGLCCTSPLYLAYSRAGLMIGVSILQGALTFAALLRLWDRWDRTSAAVLGVLLGSSLYSYQLSWFVPVLAGAAVLVVPELWRRPRRLEIAAVTAVIAVAIAAPGLLLMPTGFRAVSAQTFDRAVWQRAGDSESAEIALAVAIAAPTADVGNPPTLAARDVDVRYLPGAEGSTTQGLFRSLAEIRDTYAELQAHPGQVLVTPLSTEAGHTLLRLFGNRDDVKAALGQLREDPWDVLFDSTIPTTPVRSLTGMLAQLFASRDWESDGRLVDGPLLNPVLSPLLVLGFAAALRRRREPLMRMLCVWVLVGALLPATVGGVVPRRSVLMLPLAQALMSLAILEIAAGLAPRTRRRRWAAVLASTALLAAAVAAGGRLYFDRWDIRLQPWQPEPAPAAWGVSPDRRSRLRLTKTLKGLPGDEVVLMPRLFDRFMPYLEAVEQEPAPGARKRVLEHPGADTPEQIHRISCRQPAPFTWVSFDTPEHRELFRTVEDDFVHSTETRGAYRLLHVAGPQPDRCP
jgi:4-amino-4-deoxy-L-arabinose transferase-like glycosyltransferase